MPMASSRNSWPTRPNGHINFARSVRSKQNSNHHKSINHCQPANPQKNSVTATSNNNKSARLSSFLRKRETFGFLPFRHSYNLGPYPRLIPQKKTHTFILSLHSYLRISRFLPPSPPLCVCNNVLCNFFSLVPLPLVPLDKRPVITQCISCIYITYIRLFVTYNPRRWLSSDTTWSSPTKKTDWMHLSLASITTS